jgi:hypothetical protein
MAKPQKPDAEKRPKAEARAFFEHTVKRMLNTPPRPHVTKSRKSRKEKPTPQ